MSKKKKKKKKKQGWRRKKKKPCILITRKFMIGTGVQSTKNAQNLWKFGVGATHQMQNGQKE
jgi:hypothetical protein